MRLSTQEKTFCQIYAVNGSDGVQAAVTAGYPVESVNTEAARLLKEDGIANYIAILTTRATKTMPITHRQIFSNTFYEWLKSRR